MHVPAAINVTVPELMEQTLLVCEAMLTVSPEVEVALTANGAEPKALSAMLGKLMVCDRPVTTAKLRVTVGAASQLASPA